MKWKVATRLLVVLTQPQNLLREPDRWGSNPAGDNGTFLQRIDLRRDHRRRPAQLNLTNVS